MPINHFQKWPKNSYPGSKNPNAKLSEADVKEIRRSDLSLEELASHFKIHVQTIKKIKQRKTWTHVE